jgi:uncharacterized phage protein gp47/JayE
VSVSPDYTEFVDLSIYDKSPTDIVAAAKATLQSRIPDWVPANTNVEVMLMEALAVEIGETIFSINRLPSTMMKVLLALYGVEINSGTPATTTLTFTAYDTDGYAVPAGTEVAILTGTGEYVSFFTDVADAVVQGQTTATIAATANVNTNIANGLPQGTAGELAVALIGIDSVETGSVISNGSLPETEEAWTERGIQRLQRLVDTLVIPSHFTSAALENPLVYRAYTIDNWNSTGYASTYTWAGNVVTVTYAGHGLASGNHITVDFTSGGATADAEYTVVGITSDDVFTFALTGSGAAGDLTFWRLPGEDPGNVTVVVRGLSGNLTAPQKATLKADLEARANANLVVSVKDPTVTTVAVTTQVAVLDGYIEQTVLDAVDARLTDYLSPLTWAWGGVVRKNELISVIDQVDGVDYVSTLTLPAADVNIGEGNLADAGTITVTAV